MLIDHRESQAFRGLGQVFSPQLLQILTNTPGQPKLKPEREEAVCAHVDVEPDPDLGSAALT